VTLSPLYPIVDVDLARRRGLDPVVLGEAFLEGGVSWLQLRAKSLESAELLELAGRLAAAAARRGAALIVNDRADVARMARASGVHVGQDDLPPAAARRVVGEAALVGLSTHDEAQVDAALAEPISYLAVGPIYGTASKEASGWPVGLALVEYAAKQAGALPVVAIGGITLERAPEVIGAGARAVAVIADLHVAGDVAGRVRAFLAALGSEPSPGRVPGEGSP